LVFIVVSNIQSYNILGTILPHRAKKSEIRGFWLAMSGKWCNFAPQILSRTSFGV
jgi:hypothetical protein